MNYYQLKLIRKKEKPTVWRSVCVPSNITFCQLALILEESLQSVLTDLYEFEFQKEKYRIRELLEGLDIPTNSNYNYLHAPDTFINFWLETKPWFTFRFLEEKTGRKDRSQPEYRVELIGRINGSLDPFDSPALCCPYVIETRCNEDEPYWHDDYLVNLHLESLFMPHEGNAEYTEFPQLLDSVLFKNAGITISREVVDRETRNIESPDARTARKTDQLNLELGIAVNNMIAEYYEKDGDQYRLKVPEDEFQKELEKAEAKIAADLSGEFAEYLKEFPGIDRTEEVNLMDILMSYSKKELLSEAYEFDLHPSEKKKKEDIAAEIAAFLLDPDEMQELFLFVSDEELDAFEKVMECGFYTPTLEEEDLLEQFYSMDYIAAYESGEYSVPNDVRDVYMQLLENGYRTYHRVAKWLLLCLNAFDLILGFAPVRVLYSMFRKGKPEDFTYDDFLQLLDEFPEDINPCCFSDDSVVSALLIETGMYDVLRNEQQDVMYYIPSIEEIESYGESEYPSEDPAYLELYQWMRTEFGQGIENCEYYCTTACRIFSMGANPADFLREMTDRDLAFRSEEQLGKTIDILNRVLAHTRQARLRGHTTDEMAKMESHENFRPAPFAGTAGNILKMPGKTPDAADIAAGRGTIHGEVIPVDFIAGAGPDPAGREKNKKIGPNDPCPCGSGKKYKKCCGRNRGF